MRLPWMKAITGFFLAATLSAPAWAVNTNASTAVPGTLNYLEGNVSIADQTLNSKSIGSAQLRAGQSLTTGTGKAEVLLTPGVFLRVGDNSSVKMVSPTILNTEVDLQHGQAMLEVEQILPENDIRVTEDGATTRILKTGLYDFNSNAGWVRVFDGKALVDDNGGEVKLKGGRELDLGPAAPPKAHKFDKNANEESDLYRWSSLRSSYDAEANVNAAGIYAVDGWGPWGPGWWGAGWYWDPWFDGFAFIPGDGIFYSPFGWGFYSPWWVYDAPALSAIGTVTVFATTIISATITAPGAPARTTSKAAIIPAAFTAVPARSAAAFIPAPECSTPPVASAASATAAAPFAVASMEPAVLEAEVSAAVFMAVLEGADFTEADSTVAAVAAANAAFAPRFVAGRLPTR